MGIKIHGTRSKIRLKKMIIVSPETHSSLFSVRDFLVRKNEDMNITYNEVVKFLFDFWQCGGRDPDSLKIDDKLTESLVYDHNEMKQAIKQGKDYQLEEKE